MLAVADMKSIHVYEKAEDRMTGKRKAIVNLETQNFEKLFEAKGEVSYIPIIRKDCQKKVPQTGWLKTTEMYSLTLWRPGVKYLDAHRPHYS